MAAIGLKRLLELLVPFVQVEIFPDYIAFESAEPQRFVHQFVDAVTLEHSAYIAANLHRTILLVDNEEAPTLSQPFRQPTLNYHLEEKQLVYQLLKLLQHGHPHGNNLPVSHQQQTEKLSKREIDVLRLIVKGFINKEIADQLNIALTTVITHRKNIMTKLAMRSVSALTIYAVTHGLIEIDEI